MINHKNALIIFWTLVAITSTSWLYTLYITHVTPEYVETMSALEAKILLITGMMFLPMMVMFVAIGGGYFKQTECKNER